MKKIYLHQLLFFIFLFGCNSANNENQENVESIVSTDNVPQKPEPTINDAKADIITKDTSSNNSKYKTAEEFENRGEGWLNDPDTTGTNIRKSPNGEIAFVIKNKYHQDREPSYRLFDIIKSEGNWIYIEASQWEDEKFKGFIHNSLVEASLRSGTQKIYNTENGQVAETIEVQPNSFQKVNILVYKKTGWVKIKFNFEQSAYEGWVRTYRLCGTPYTSCN